MDARKKTITVIVAGVLAVALGGIGVAVASSGGDDGETPVTGTALQAVSAAALAVTGGGTVTETEVGDEEGYYEVEVTLPDGSRVDVHLDENYAVLGSETDSETDGESPDGDGTDG